MSMVAPLIEIPIFVIIALLFIWLVVHVVSIIVKCLRGIKEVVKKKK